MKPAISKEKKIIQRSDQVDGEVKASNDGRHFLAVFFLSFLWGSFGVDRFYLGKVGTGLLKLITFGGFGLWVIVDLVLIMAGSMRDKEGRPMREFARYKKFAINTVIIFAVVLGLVTLVTGGILIFVVYQLVNDLINNGGALQNLLPGGLQGSGLSPSDLESLGL